MKTRQSSSKPLLSPTSPNIHLPPQGNGKSRMKGQSLYASQSQTQTHNSNRIFQSKNEASKTSLQNSDIQELLVDMDLRNNNSNGDLIQNLEEQIQPIDPIAILEQKEEEIEKLNFKTVNEKKKRQSVSQKPLRGNDVGKLNKKGGSSPLGNVHNNNKKRNTSVLENESRSKSNVRSNERDASQVNKKSSIFSQTVSQMGKLKNVIKINLVNTKYNIIKECAQDIGWQVITDPLYYQEDFDVFWNDIAISAEKIQSLKPFQKVNHFPSMFQITRKGMLAKNLLKMKKAHPIDYNFFPKTWILPKDLRKLKQYYLSKGDKPPYLICKPDGLSQGKGIFMTNKIDDILSHLSQQDPEKKQILIVQKYIKNPYLIDKLKFDLRIYVLVTSCNPMKIFLYEEGLARFATLEYTLDKLDDTYIHLTNYAINKNSSKYEENDEGVDAQKGTKRSLKSVFERLENDGINVAILKEKMKDIYIKTLLAIQSELLHNYRMNQPAEKEGQLCFEILGFDILIDQKGKPWLLEVNQAPSFNTDTKLDYQVKRGLIMDTFKLLNISQETKQRVIDRYELEKKIKVMNKKDQKVVQEKKIILEQYFIQQNLIYERQNMGRYSKIYPLIEGYDSLLSQYQNLYSSGGIDRHPQPRVQQNEIHIQEYYQIFLNTSNMFMCDTVVRKINENRKKLQNTTNYGQKFQLDSISNQNIFKMIEDENRIDHQLGKVLAKEASTNQKLGFQNYNQLLDFIMPRQSQQFQASTGNLPLQIETEQQVKSLTSKELILPLSNKQTSHLVIGTPEWAEANPRNQQQANEQSIKYRNKINPNKEKLQLNLNHSNIYQLRDRVPQQSSNQWIQKMKKIQEQKSLKKYPDHQVAAQQNNFSLPKQSTLSVRDSLEINANTNTNCQSNIIKTQENSQFQSNSGRQSFLKYMSLADSNSAQRDSTYATQRAQDGEVDRQIQTQLNFPHIVNKKSFVTSPNNFISNSHQILIEQQKSGAFTFTQPQNKSILNMMPFEQNELFNNTNRQKVASQLTQTFFPNLYEINAVKNSYLNHNQFLNGIPEDYNQSDYVEIHQNTNQIRESSHLNLGIHNKKLQKYQNRAQLARDKSYNQPVYLNQLPHNQLQNFSDFQKSQNTLSLDSNSQIHDRIQQRLGNHTGTNKEHSQREQINTMSILQSLALSNEERTSPRHQKQISNKILDTRIPGQHQSKSILTQPRNSVEQRVIQNSTIYHQRSTIQAEDLTLLTSKQGQQQLVKMIPVKNMIKLVAFDTKYGENNQEDNKGIKKDSGDRQTMILKNAQLVKKNKANAHNVSKFLKDQSYY